jgi:hypothetical protein
MLPLSWQWLFNGHPIKDATNSSLTLSPVTAGQSGDYAVTVTNLAGTAVSTIATLIVRIFEEFSGWMKEKLGCAFRVKTLESPWLVSKVSG